MATAFSHFLVGYTFSKGLKVNNKALIGMAMVSSAMPDIDVIGFFHGIPYESTFGHRGFTHSIFFALIWSLFFTIIIRTWRNLKAWLLLFLSTVSHGVIDAMTSGGKGIGFFIPLTDERFFLSFRPIKVAPIGIRNFFSEWGMATIKSELIWVGIPCLVILIFILLIKWK